MSKSRIFISYTRADKKYRDALLIRLKNLEDTDPIEYWTDGDIVPGEQWKETILKELESADIILLLVSPEFLASDFIRQVECPFAVSRALARRAKLISIIVRSVDWDEQKELKQFQALPPDAVPISTFEREGRADEGWLKVQEGIKVAIRSEIIEVLANSYPTHMVRAALHNSSTRSLMSCSSRTLLGVEQPLSFVRITDFWNAEPVLQEGKLVEIKCSLSKYAPLTIGDPSDKRAEHLALRRLLRNVSDHEEANINTMLSFSAGQMVWRLRLQECPWRYLGLYQAIVRNSIPLFVDNVFYRDVVDKIFVEKNTSTFEAKIVGRVIRLPCNFVDAFPMQMRDTRLVRPVIKDDKRPVYGIMVGEEQTSIEYIGVTTYLDGDIWLAVKDGGVTTFQTRFCDLADERDVEKQASSLEKELKHDAEVVFQFDQIQPRFKKTQPIDEQELLLKRYFFQ